MTPVRIALQRAAIAIAAIVVAECGGGGGSNSQPAVLQSIAIMPVPASAELGALGPQLTATGSYNDGSTANLTDSAAWSSSDPTIATIDNAGNVTAVGVGSTTIQAAVGTLSASATVSVTPPGHSLVKNAGLWVEFERRGSPTGFFFGEVIQTWTQLDAVLGTTVSEEVSLQLDKMKAMGINTVLVESRTADPTFTGNFTPPDCNEGPVLGFQFPQPTATELANLPLFFDMAQSKGIKIWLRLVNTHMEQQPPTNSQTWIGAILGAVGAHPALDLVIFDGTPNVITKGNGGQSCGTPAEPPLYLGPSAVPATYVQWAIGYAKSLGISPQKLSAEAIVGAFFLESQPPAGPETTDRHLWSPIAVLKTIFDNLNIPASQRTYALSFYEHRKCSDAQSLPCADARPHDWAEQTLEYVTGVVGSGPRIVATEMGDFVPVDQVNWNTQRALESLVFLMHKYKVDGGAFWRWTNFESSEDSDPTLATPVKPRGAAFTFNPVQKEVVDMGGFHLPLVPNGSFEGSAVGGVPSSWTATGTGTVSQYLLTQEGAAQPEVPSRGVNAMRAVTGAGSATVTATSVTIPVTASTAFTTTANMRFAWTGDPAAGTGPSPSRPQVAMTVLYFQANGSISAVRTQDSFPFFQEDSTAGFATFPMQYITPGDAAFVKIQFGASRNGLANPITLDVDNVR